MSKRILALLLCVLMISSCMSVGVFAEGEAVVEPEQEEILEELVPEEIIEEPAPIEEPEQELPIIEESIEEELDPAEPDESEFLNEGENEASVTVAGQTTNYATMTEAVAAAVAATTTPTTITLLKDISTSTRLEMRDSTGSSDTTVYDITLNLNGHNYTYSGTNSGAFILSKGCKLTFTGTGEFNTGSKQFLYLSASANEINILSGTFKTTSTSLFYTGTSTGTAKPVINISGGSFEDASYATFGTAKNDPDITITGGTFNFDISSYVATGYEAVSNEGTWTVQQSSTPVAKVLVEGDEEQSFTDISAAVAAAVAAGTTPATITLLEDVSLNDRLELRDSTGTNDAVAYVTTLDLGGKTLTYSGGSSGAFLLAKNGIITITNGTLDTGSKQLLSIASSSNTVNITSGTYKTTSTSLFYTGSTTTGTAKPTINISGGTFTDAANITRIGTATKEGTVNEPNTTVTGGTFKFDVTGYLDMNYQAAENEGIWTVTLRPVVATVTVAGTPYESRNLANAFLNASTTAKTTIQLLADIVVDENLKNPANTDIELDLNNHSITLASSGTDNTNMRVFYVLGALSVSGTGTIDATDNEGHYLAYVGKGKTMNITGGTWLSGKDDIFATGDTTSVITVSGGWFNQSVGSSYRAEGYKSVEISNPDSDDAPYTVTNTTGSITYSADGAENVPAAKTGVAYVSGKSAAVSLSTTIPYKPGFNFVNWSTEPEGAGTTISAGGQFAYNGGDVTLYANWQAIDPADYPVEGYATVTEAVKAAEDGTQTTVALIKDVTESITIPAEKNIVLDLNGHSLQGLAIGSTITNKGTLVIKDTIGTGAITGTAQSKGGAIDNYGTLTIDEGSFTITGTAPDYGGAIYNRGSAVVTINGGVINGTSESGSGGAVYNCSNGVVTVNGGQITGEATNYGGAVYNKGTFTMTGGTLIGTPNATVTNSAIHGAGDSSGPVTITGGCFSGVIAGGNNSVIIDISGGLFSAEPDAAYIASSYEVTANAAEATAADYPYAVTIKHFTVTFDMQGHGTEIAEQTIDYGELVTAPEAPEASGYTFGGWYKEAGCENAWDFDVDTVDETTVLYAKWTKNTTDLSACTVTLSYTSKEYTGSALKPAVTVKLPDGSVAGISDYTVSYANNTNVGKASVTVTATADGALTGSVTKTFAINPKATTIKSVANTSTGIKVTWTKVTGATGYKIYRSKGTGTFSLVKTITSGSTVTWTDTATITGGTKCNYKIVSIAEVSGTTYKSGYCPIKATYRLAQPAIKSVENTSTGIKITWGKVTGATGYKLYRSTGTGSYKLIKTFTSGKTVSYSDTGATTNGTRYRYKIVAVKTVSGTAYTSAESAVKTMYRLSRPTISSATSTKAGQITVKWGKNDKATGYQIKYVKGTTEKTITVTSKATVSKVLSSLTKGATYKISIRSYKTVDGTKYYSAWSAAKSVTVSK